jgi:hypothetical protein
MFSCFPLHIVKMRDVVPGARLLSNKTAVSHAWITKQFAMRSPANVTLALHERKQELKGLPAELRNTS